MTCHRIIHLELQSLLIFLSSTANFFAFLHIYSFSQASLSTPTWLDELSCRGSESRLINCPANPIGNEDCTHSEDVALVCKYE